MNKSDLIDAVSDTMGSRKTATEAVNAVIDTIQESVARGDKVTITGFGVFEKQVRPARTARNPATGAAVKVPKTSVPKFRAGADFKAMVNTKSGAARATASRAGSTRTTTAKATTAKATSGRMTATRATAGRSTAKATTASATAGRSTATRATATRATSRGTAGRATTARTTAGKTAGRSASGKVASGKR
jgi:DNA-binding protein HU-beta